MNIHEYQAKSLLGKFGVLSTDFFVISSMEKLEEILESEGITEGVLKVQIHAGGRGKAGGVKIAHTRKEIEDYAKELLGKKIVNAQTGPRGVIARQLILCPLVPIKREFYLGVVIDRQRLQATMIASREGGMEIEEVAAKNPEKILKFAITDEGAIRSYNLLRLVKFMGWEGAVADKGKQQAKALAKAFLDIDASLVEINPLVETQDGDILALDAKVSIDESALFRHPDIQSYFDPFQHTDEEVRAMKHDLAYVGLDGDIGCMVNGAGLAMATMDIIHLYGSEPANFLDVGGGASEDKVAEGFKIILSDPKVKAILVNIFGGIMNCETLARGIVAAARDLKVQVPLVVRMEGTNVEEGKKRLRESGLPIILADNLDDAAKKVVAAKLQGKA